jgi:hypothetical protein
MHGQTCSFWANLTPVSLKRLAAIEAAKPGAESLRLANCLGPH